MQVTFRVGRKRLPEVLNKLTVKRANLGCRDRSVILKRVTPTQIDRLVHAKIFGGDEPYEKRSSSSLVRQLETAEQEHEAADRYYEFEIRAHKVNVSLANVGDATLENASLVLDFPRIEGVGVADGIHGAPGGNAVTPEGYPVVDVGSRTIRVQSSVGQIQRGATVKAFAQPLRVWCREPAAGKTLPIDYVLHGRGLREPIAGTLRIHVAEAASATARTTRRARKKKPATQGVGNG